MLKAKVIDDCVAVFEDGEWAASYGAHPLDLKKIAAAFRRYFKQCKETGRAVSFSHSSPALSLWSKGVLEWRSVAPGDIEYNPHHPDFDLLGDADEGDEEGD